MRTFTIEEIKTYLLAQDSLGDAIWNLCLEKIDEACNTPAPKEQPIDTTSQAYITDEISEADCWDDDESFKALE